MKNIILLYCLAIMFISCTPQKSNSQPNGEDLSSNDFNQKLPSDIEQNGERWFEIGSYGKVLAFSKIAKPGRISIFIMSTDWCGPCKKLKRDLKASKIDKKHVDFYYVNMSEGHNYDELKETEAYKYWRIYERIEEWPTVTVTSPLTNVIKRYSTSSLAKETNHSGETAYNRTVDLIDRLNKLIKEHGFSKDVIMSQTIQLEKNSKKKKDEKISFRVIKTGETIYTIVKEYREKGYNITKDDIGRWNNIEDTSKVDAGTRLKIYTK